MKKMNVCIIILVVRCKKNYALIAWKMHAFEVEFYDRKTSDGKRLEIITKLQLFKRNIQWTEKLPNFLYE